jgi:hypothetical protein
MSIDYKIQNKCDHKINWDIGVLSSDAKRIDITYPIASKTSVVIKVNFTILDKSTYSIQEEPIDLTIQKKSYISMRHKIRLFDPIIEVSYTTYTNSCPKCSGAKYLDDFVYTSGGDILTAKDEFLLIQTVEKYIVTRLGSNKYQTWMGTGLQNMIGTKILDGQLLTTKITEEINTAIDKLKDMQKQLIARGRPVSTGELFGQLLSVDVQQDQTDSTTIQVVVSFTAQSGKRLEYTQLLELNSNRQRIAS